MKDLLIKWQELLRKGIKHLSAENFFDAENYLKACLAEAELLDIPIAIAFSQRLLSNVQIKNNKITEAENGFSRALKICLKLNNKKGIAEAKAGLAYVNFLKKKYSEAICLYKEAINIYPVNASSLRLVALYCDLGQAYEKTSKWEKAEEVFLKAENICMKNKYYKEKGEINLYLGEIYYNIGEINKAKARFLKSACLFAKTEDLIYLADTHQYLALIYFENNLFEEALQYQYRVIALYLKHYQYIKASESYYLLSKILQYSKILDQAEDSLKLSLKYYKGFELGLAVRYHSLAIIAITKKDYLNAKNYYFKALKYFQLYGDGSKVGEISEELTYLLKYEDYFMEEELYNYFNDSEIQMPKYKIMLRLANVLQHKGNNIAALRCSWKALELARINQYNTSEINEIETLVQKISEQIRKK